MSRLPFELLLALRYLRPKRTFVSIITLISILGVTLGVAVLIIVISVMSGFDSQLRQAILGFNSHLKIFQLDPTTGRRVAMENYALVMAAVNSNRNVVGSSPIAFGRVMVRTERPDTDEQAPPDVPIMLGVDMQTASNISLSITNIIRGSNDLSGHKLLVGKDFADNMDLHVGDRVAVYTPHDIADMKREYDNTNQENKLVIPPKDFTVSGVFDTGYYEYNANFIATSLENFQDLWRLDDDVHGVMVVLKDPYRADAVRAELDRVLGLKYRITTWKEENNLILAVMAEKSVMLYILFFIVIVAAFGITCTLITFVVLKTREIGVMKALGANSRQIMWIFLSQSLVVSILGVLIGLIAGMLAIHYRNPFLHLMRRLTGLELFPENIYGFSELPALIVPGDILIICGGSLVICLLAAAFPAWHASRLKPVEALRHE